MKVIHISDLHIDHLGHGHSIEKAAFLLDAISAHSFDHLVITGDISDNGSDEELKIFHELLINYNLNKPELTTLIIGNHDIFGGVQRAEDIITFPERCARTDYDGKITVFHGLFTELLEGTTWGGHNSVYPFFKPVGDYAFCALNSIDRYSTLKNPLASNGRIDDEQFSDIYELFWKILESDKQIIVLIHHHFNKIAADSKDWIQSVWNRIEKQTLKLRKKKKLLALFQSFPVRGVLHGHHHVSEKYERSGINFFNAGNTINNQSGIVQFNMLDFSASEVEFSIKKFNFPLTKKKYFLLPFNDKAAVFQT